MKKYKLKSLALLLCLTAQGVENGIVENVSGEGGKYKHIFEEDRISKLMKQDSPVLNPTQEDMKQIDLHKNKIKNLSGDKRTEVTKEFLNSINMQKIKNRIVIIKDTNRDLKEQSNSRFDEDGIPLNNNIQHMNDDDRNLFISKVNKWVDELKNDKLKNRLKYMIEILDYRAENAEGEVLNNHNDTQTKETGLNASILVEDDMDDMNQSMIEPKNDMNQSMIEPKNDMNQSMIEPKNDMNQSMME